MKKPNTYYDTIGSLVSECRNDLRELFNLHGITSLDTNFQICDVIGVDFAYAHVYNEFEGGSIEYSVSKVEIENDYIFIKIADEDMGDKRYSLEGDCQDFDIFSIYDTCYQLLSIYDVSYNRIVKRIDTYQE